MTQCKGLYADVNKKSDFKQIEQIKNIEKIVARYEEYRQGFVADFVNYDKFNIGGTFFVLSNLVLTISLSRL